MSEQLLYLQFQSLPDELKKEVMDFVGYLMNKYQLDAPKPQPKGGFGKYRGILKSGLTMDEIDAQLSRD